MEEIVKLALQSVLLGGPGAIVTILLAIIGLLVWDRHKLLKDNQKKDEKIEKIIEDYYKGNITITEALNGLKMVLLEIKVKL